MSNINYKIIASSLMLAILSACGGSPSDATTSAAAGTTTTTSTTTSPATTSTTTTGTSATTTAVVGPLTKYAGVWKADCYPGTQSINTDTLNISSDGNSMTSPYKEESYSTSTCTGAIVATEVDSPPATSTFIKTVANASVTMLSGATITASVDLLNIVNVNQTVNVTGSAVTQTISNGVARWSIAGPGGYEASSVPLTRSARTSQAGLFLLNGKLIIVNTVAGSATSFTEDSEASAVTN